MHDPGGFGGAASFSDATRHGSRGTCAASFSDATRHRGCAASFSDTAATL